MFALYCIQKQVKHCDYNRVTAATHVSCTHHCPCLCLGLCPSGGRGVERPQRSSSPAVCAWRRRPAWGRCSAAGGDTLAVPSPSPPAHRLRPSWSACSPERRAKRGGGGKEKGNGCQSNGHVAIATDEEGHNSKEEKKVEMTRGREKSQLVHSQS